MEIREAFLLLSSTYNQSVLQVLKENGCLISIHKVSYETYLRKEIADNLSKIPSTEIMILDFSSILDSESEILDGLNTIKIMAPKTKIIVLAPRSYEGDPLLTKVFQMGIYNIIATDDHNIIREKMQYCIEIGMEYADALVFKEEKNYSEKERTIVKTEVKQTVNKVTIAFKGYGKHIGTTHNSIILANVLRKKGYRVALVEMNNHKSYESIRFYYDEKMFQETYFTLNGVDYYPGASEHVLANVLGQSYNFIIMDLGSNENSDSIMFNKADVRFIVSGSKAWELDTIKEVFDKFPKETYVGYQYLFNLAPINERKYIKESLGEITSVHFSEYSEDPIYSENFPNVEIILKDYMPTKVEKKKGFFSKKER